MASRAYLKPKPACGGGGGFNAINCGAIATARTAAACAAEYMITRIIQQKREGGLASEMFSRL